MGKQCYSLIIFHWSTNSFDAIFKIYTLLLTASSNKIYRLNPISLVEQGLQI